MYHHPNGMGPADAILGVFWLAVIGRWLGTRVLRLQKKLRGNLRPEQRS